MEKPAKRKTRLNTENFTVVTSRAVRSVDYDAKKKIIEIEFTTGQVYHYENALPEQWRKIYSLIPKQKGLGGYINTEFKSYFQTGDGDYYLVI
jgi:hypothetical protein